MALASIAISIGANVGGFGLVNALVWRELPVRDPGQLTEISMVGPSGGRTGMSFPAYRELARTQQAFTTGASTRVAIVSASLARRLFPDRDAAGAVGARIRLGTKPGQPEVEVVGVASDARLYGPKNPNLFAVYVPMLCSPRASTTTRPSCAPIASPRTSSTVYVRKFAA